MSTFLRTAVASLILALGACSSGSPASSGGLGTCPDTLAFPACPPRAVCGGPCDPDGGIVECGSIDTCGATCFPGEGDAGARWTCLLP